MSALPMNGNPKQLAEKGEAIYRAKFQQEYERLYAGKYAAIDIATEKAYVADTPEAAVDLLQKDNPQAFFHLVRIGAAGVFKVGFSVHNNNADYWVF